MIAFTFHASRFVLALACVAACAAPHGQESPRATSAPSPVVPQASTKEQALLASASPSKIAETSGQPTPHGKWRGAEATVPPGWSREPTSSASPPQSNNPSPSPTAWLGAESVASNGGAYRVLWSHGSAPIPRGDPFSIDAWVFAANDPNTPLENVALDVDAAMPAHGHGMNRVAKITRLSGGQFHAESLLFHMPGHWELYFDVTHGALTERAQVSVELE